MPKRIQASVGFGGRNSPADVMTAQYLLNCVPAVQGGPIRELAVDGLCGPLTMGAIKKFQTAAIGRTDGRIDPGGNTIQALLQYDPAPNQPIMLGAGVKTPVKYGASVKSPEYPGAYKFAGGPAAKGMPVKQPGTSDVWAKQPGKTGGMGGKSGF